MAHIHQSDKRRDCSLCDHFLYVGEGDHVCELEMSPEYSSNSIIPLMDEWEITSHWNWCRGKKWKSKD